MVQRVVEHPVRIVDGRVKFPAIETLERKGKPLAQRGEWKALLQCRDGDIPTFLSWIDDAMPARCRVFGIYAWEEFDVRIDREFKGLIIYFASTVDAVHFRLAWSDFYMPDPPPNTTAPIVPLAA